MAALGDIRRLTWRIFLLQQMGVLWVTLPGLYLTRLVMGVTTEQLMWILKYIQSYTSFLFGFAFPFLIIWVTLKRGLTVADGEPTEVVLTRLLKIPRQIDLFIQLNYAIALLQYMSIVAWKFNNSWITAPWGVVLFTSLTMLTMLWTRIEVIRLLHPIALREFMKNPRIELKGGGILWPRQKWYLPYAFAVFVSCAIIMTVTAIIGESQDVFELLVQKLENNNGGSIAEIVYGTVSELARNSTIAIVLIALYLLISAAVAAWSLARHESEATQAIQQSIESLASGQPRLVQWVSTDEIGDLASATARAFEKLRAFSLSLQESARQLGQSADQLDGSNSEQNAVLTRQAAALQETQVTAQEIKNTSLLTAQKAEAVLKRVEQADDISRSGEMALERSMASLRDIRMYVSQMTDEIKALDSRAQQIRNITQSVKDLADQSNMLALNAAIEAVRSGEAGKGFGVVAREIRSLADQSIAATNNVRKILQDISSAIRSTVNISEQGAKKIEASLVEINTFGDSMRELSSIVRDNASSVRQISAAVSQQNTGISQIFQAVSDLSAMMEETMSRLKMTGSAIELVQDVSKRVFGAVESNDWQHFEKNQDLK